MKWKKAKRISVLILPGVMLLTMSGCGAYKKIETKNLPAEERSLPVSENESLGGSGMPENPAPEASGTDETKWQKSVPQYTITLETAQKEAPEMPAAREMDWAKYFEGRNGAAVFYLPVENRYEIYNPELAGARNSPCSTFKIISSLAGLESGVIPLTDSERRWSGETFWNENWNRDMDYPEAFRTSCVWYFRQVTDELGPETIQKFLDELQYGNRDISDWDGLFDNPQKNRLLRGFWIESSLKVSPMEQVEVLGKIFYHDNNYSPETIKTLTQAMKTEYQLSDGAKVYGKTGMGKRNGITADCWFTGFADRSGGRTFFCIYLGQTPENSISTELARKIALEILECV